jgi:hypothetical protein
VSAALAVLRASVAALRLNRNRRQLLTLRGTWSRPRLSLHEGLLAHGDALAEIPRWIASRGRGAFPALRAALDAVLEAGRAEERARHPPPALPPLGGPLDLEAVFAQVHAAWFPGLPRPAIAWARGGGGRRRRRRIRFASYRRDPPRIAVHRSLDRPWIARAFVEHVLHHELCHHAQACAPRRGERPHSTRFRIWEARFPGLDAVLAWERAHLEALLDPGRGAR